MEIECWNCKAIFIPEKLYEFPMVSRCWHKCFDGEITCIDVDPLYFCDSPFVPEDEKRKRIQKLWRAGKNL